MAGSSPLCPSMLPTSETLESSGSGRAMAKACHRDADAANRHYAELESLLDIHYGYSPRLILGDFNACLIKALPHDSDAVGPYT